jgi:hypothetical protein
MGGHRRLRFNVPGGSYFQMQGSYTQGALRYISHTQWPLGSAARFGVGNSVGLGWLMDGIYGNSGEIELTRAWGIYASWEQVWNPKWKTSIYGGWIAVSYNDNAKALIAAATCGNQAGAGNFLPAVFTATAIANFPTQASGSITNVTNCDPNWQLGYVGTAPNGMSPPSSTSDSTSTTPSSTPASRGSASSALRVQARARNAPGVSTISKTRTTWRWLCAFSAISGNDWVGARSKNSAYPRVPFAVRCGAILGPERTCIRIVSDAASSLRCSVARRRLGRWRHRHNSQRG